MSNTGDGHKDQRVDASVDQQRMNVGRMMSRSKNEQRQSSKPDKYGKPAVHIPLVRPDQMGLFLDTVEGAASNQGMRSFVMRHS
jgi:hypothetical protein